MGTEAMTQTYIDRIASYLKRHRYQWVRAERLMQIGGVMAWRTRVSECRTFYRLPIENRVTKRKGKPTISEYRLGRRRAR